MGLDRRRSLGIRGEQAALDYLEAQGYRLLSRNFRQRQGEIDLIMQDGPTLVFCEVKTRSSRAAGAAFESYGPHQQRRITKVAKLYLARNAWSGPVRFDLLALEKVGPEAKYRPYHLIDVLAVNDFW